MKPTDTDGLSDELKHTISEYGNHNTVVIHNLFHEKGSKHKLRGEADVYARAFSPQSCTPNDMAKLKYIAVINLTDPDKSTISYKISKSAWKPADKFVETEPNQPTRFCGQCTVRLHDCSDILMDGKNEYLKNGHLHGYILFEEKPDPKYGTSLYSDANDFGNMRTTVYFNINGILNGKEHGLSVGDGHTLFNLATKKRIVAENSTAKDEVTVQQTIPVAKGFPFADKVKPTAIDYRVHGKLRLVRFGKNDNTEFPQLTFERASFSCMIHN